MIHRAKVAFCIVCSIFYTIAVEGLPETVFWDNNWPSDLVPKIPDGGPGKNYFMFPPSTGLENPYVISGQTNLNGIGNDPSATGLADIFNNNTPNDEVEVKTWNGSWISSLYLPDTTQISDLMKFQLTVSSSWGVDVYFNNGDSKRVNDGEVLILAMVGGVWLDEDGYNQIATSAPSESPSTEAENNIPNLLPGTVLFAQSQIIPSKHRNGGDDTQPHLVAMRKALVMLKPHTDMLPKVAGDMAIEMIVYDGNGNVVTTTNLNIPENIPKHDSWVDLGGVDVSTIVFPSDLTNPYVIQGQSNLNTISNDPDASALTQIMNKPNQYEVEIKTWDGSWVRDIYLPKGSSVPKDSKIKITCDSGYSVNIYSPQADGGWKIKSYGRGDRDIFILVNELWITENDLVHNQYVFGHGFYTATISSEWVQPGMSLEFTTFLNGNSEEYVGILDDIDVGAPTELIITALDAGFLTEPRDAFKFKDDFTTHREYFETAPLSRLIVVQYETMHLTEIMLPDGTFYTAVSNDNGGWHSGDMRQFIGKVLLSHGIDLANYGINSSKGNSESSHPFTCALLAAHNTVGLYQNGRVVHGGSGGNGMVTLDNSIGNEFSHEVGHNYGLGHYVDGFKGSVHRPASEVNSSWGWDSEKNVFYPNFSQKNTGRETCLNGECQSPYLGKYQFGTDSMAGGSPQYSNRFTLYTPNTSRIIQNFLEKKARWDPSSSTGFRKFNSATKTMDEFVNQANGNKVPTQFHVPVTTIVGYYDPDNQGLRSYIYPAMHGALGFVYDADFNGGSNGNDCKLVIEINSNPGAPLEYRLSGSAFTTNYMNKFHVNVATDDGPNLASIYCGSSLLVSRSLDGPDGSKPSLEYTVTGIPLTETPSPSTAPTSTPTTVPTSTPTTAPTPTAPIQCADSTASFKVEWKGKQKNKYCTWVADNQTKRRCAVDGVSAMCADTCDACSSCQDSTLTMKLSYKGRIVKKTCSWVADRKTAERCTIDGVANACRSTCSEC